MYSQAVGFELIEPGCCNVPFLMSDSLYTARRNDHKSWWCPSCGCCRHFTGDSEETKLKRQLGQERNRRQTAEAGERYAQRQVSAQKAAKTRVLNRIKNGVCPCCNRYFKNLHAHMVVKHKGKITLKEIRQADNKTQLDIAKLLNIPAPYVSAYERGEYVPENAKVKLDETVTNWK